MKISFIVPAFNESALIEDCLRAIHDACSAVSISGSDFEVIVTDNNSTDDTARKAAAAGARVVSETVNQISRARNTGARSATGEWLVFVDADSILNPPLLGAVAECMNIGGYAGFGSVMRMDDIPWTARFSIWFWNRLSVWFSWAAGSFFVCRRDLFEELGGFSEELYVSEEIELSRRIKKLARKRGLRFCVLADFPLQTSNRKMHLYSDGELFGQLIRLVLRPRTAVKRPADLDVWYDGRR